MHSPLFSIIVPVFNRPQEIDELLASLLEQSHRNFEVIVVEDGSTVRCDHIVDRYRDKLSIQYFFKPNTGPGPSRNFGFVNARGKYFLVFDSDCIIPSSYLQAVSESLDKHHWEAWGGPDRAHESFTAVQRAMGYTMSSFLTTGGIRGGKKRVGTFQPRSFNMGISRRVFEVTGGFKLNRLAEDIELSIRIRKAGFKIGLIQEAFVYHKRRTNFRDFYRQVYNFGRGRVIVGRLHPKEIKPTHWFPALFLIGIALILFMPLVTRSLFLASIGLMAIYILSIIVHAYFSDKSLRVALLAAPAALLQLTGYGAGFLREKFKLRN